MPTSAQVTVSADATQAENLHGRNRADIPVIEAAEDDDGPFLYIDTASARAGIAAVNAKVESRKIAIVGLGGTGAHLLDLIAKSPVAQIDLYDGDILLQHNAFRYPGAVPLKALEAKLKKVNYLA